MSEVAPGAPPAAAPVPPPAAAPAPAAAAPGSADELAALRRELDALKTSNAEKTRALEFWYQKASKGEKGAEKAADAEPEVDLLDLITTKGAKGLKEFLKGQGLMSRDEAEALVNGKARQMVKETELMARYPDLKKEDSDFFKVTAKEYGRLKSTGVAEADAMEIAAERTELALLREGKLKTPKQQEDEAKAQREAERRARIQAQAGERGSRAAAEDEGDDDLSDDNMAAVRQLADALDIPLDKAKERYVARAKQGVNVALKLDRGRK